MSHRGTARCGTPQHMEAMKICIRFGMKKEVVLHVEAMNICICCGMKKEVVLQVNNRKMYACMLNHFSCVQLCEIPWTVLCQVPVHGILQERILEW